MVIKAKVEVVLTRRAIDSRQLQFGSSAHESHFVENHLAVFDEQSAFEVFGCLIENLHFAHVGCQRKVNIRGHEDRIRCLVGIIVGC